MLFHVSHNLGCTGGAFTCQRTCVSSVGKIFSGQSNLLVRWIPNSHKRPLSSCLFPVCWYVGTVSAPVGIHQQLFDIPYCWSDLQQQQCGTFWITPLCSMSSSSIYSCALNILEAKCQNQCSRILKIPNYHDLCVLHLLSFCDVYLSSKCFSSPMIFWLALPVVFPPQ